MKNIRFFGALSGLWLLAAGMIFCQDFERAKEEITDSAWIRAGMFFISSAFTVSNVGYNTNIFVYENAVQGDTTADLGLELMASAIFKDMLIVQLKETPQYSYYAENRDQRVMNNWLQLNVFYRIGRVGLQYQYDRPRLSSRPNSEFGARLQHWQRNHLLSLDYGSRDRFYLNVYAQSRAVEYQAERYLGDFSVDDLFGRTERWYGFSVNRVTPAQTSVSMQVEYFRVLFSSLPERNKKGGQASATIAFAGARGLNGSLQLGYRFVLPESSEFKEYSRPFGVGNLELRVAQRFRMRLQYLLDTRYSFFSTDLVYDESSAGVGLEFEFAPRISISYFARLGQRDYRSLAGLDVDRLDKYQFSTITLTVSAFVHLELGLVYNIIRSDSNTDRFDMSFNSLGFFMRYEF